MKNQVYSILAMALLFVAGCKHDSSVALTGLEVTPDKVSLEVGATKALQVSPLPENASLDGLSLLWESGNASVVSVSGTGIVKALSAGTADVVVSVKGQPGINRRVPVTVFSKNVPLTGISVSPESLALTVGEMKQLTAKPEPANATDVSFQWNSEDRNVATVNISGGVVAQGKGSTVISVRAGGFEKRIPVTVTQPLIISFGTKKYEADTLNYEMPAEGITWFKFSLPGFENGFGTFGKGLVVNALEIDLSIPGNRLEVCPASPATWGNVERPSAMYARKEKEYAGTETRPVAAINGDFYLLKSGNNTGYDYINNRPIGMEASNGMLVQTPFSSTNGIVIQDNGSISFREGLNFTGKVVAGGETFALKEVNGFAGAGELVLFNNLSNSYPTDSAFAWSPYVSTMVSLTHPVGGWKTNNKMEFTVSGIDHDVETTIPAASPYKGKDFNGQGAILVGNPFGSPGCDLEFSEGVEPFHSMTVSTLSSHWEVNTTGGDPFVFTSTLASGFTAAKTIEFSFEYQSERAIDNFQIFYGKPGAAAGVSTPENLHLDGTGIDAADVSKWRTFTLDLKSALSNHQWGQKGHALRLDFGSGAGERLLVRKMKIAVTYPDNSSGSFLDKLEIGDQVEVTMEIKAGIQPIPGKHLNIIGCQSLILQGGYPINTWNEAHPRTAVGWSQDGKKIYLLVVDGRRTDYSTGTTTGQLGTILKALGAYTGVNLDGGGSSCMVVNGEVKNRSSDASERAVGNGLIVLTKR